MTEKWIKTLSPKGGGSYFGLFAIYWQAIGTLVEDHEVYFDYCNPDIPYSDAAPMKSKNVWEYYFQQPYGKSMAQVNEEIFSGAFGPYVRDDFNSFHYINFLDGIKIFEHPKIEKIKEWSRRVVIHGHITDKADKFYQDQMAGHKVLGVQKRGTDHFTTGHGKGGKIALDKIYFEVDSMLPAYDKVFLISDELPTVQAFKKRYGDRLVHYDDATLSPDATAIHVNRAMRGYKIGEDVLIEGLLLSRCDYLLAMASNISLFAAIRGGMPFHKTDDHVKYWR
jgi:hypothetical protein